MSGETARMVCFKLSPEIRAAVDEYVIANNTTITDLYRALTQGFLSGTLSPGPAEGYRQARGVALHLVMLLLEGAKQALPQTLEEAIERYGLIGEDYAR